MMETIEFCNETYIIGGGKSWDRPDFFAGQWPGAFNSGYRIAHHKVVT